jgi:hypothetical protein
VTRVELLGTVTANQAANGLGFNLDDNQDWQFAAAAAAGATHVRMQCPWVTVEKQTPPPNNVPATQQYVQDPNCVLGFQSAKKYGIHPTVLAAFGPPYHQILTVTIPNGAQVGATTLNVQFASGVGGETLANIKFPYDYIQGPPHQAPNYGVFTSAGSYQGAFITGVTLTDSTHATLKLASAVTVALPAGNTQYLINEVLYPSAATTSPTDPSVIAYGNYVSFLAQSMANAGVTGDIEIWNEPPWMSDPWDNRGALYDADLWPGPGSPGPSDSGEPNFGFVGNLQNKTLPPGITLTWNGTSGNGEASILAPNMYAESGVYANQPANVITKESFHPYGYEPEQVMFETSCLEATAQAYPAWPAGQFTNCYLPGEPVGTNIMAAVQYSMINQVQNPAYGVGHSVTETGIIPPRAGLRAAQARFVMRQFLGFQAEGITPIEFFKLYDASTPNDPNFSFVEYTGGTSYTKNPDYVAISGFMADIKPISNLPVAAYPASSLASVASYSGTFPLSTVHMVGAREGATANSDMFAVWQRSYAGQNAWITMASPAPAPVTVNIPTGMQVTQVINVDTRATVAYTSSGQQISFQVADDPIEILLDPATSSQPAQTTLSLVSNPSSATYGSPVVLTATLAPYSGQSGSSNGETVTFYNGSTNLGTAKLASGVATLTVSSLPLGTDAISASYAGDSDLSASSASATVSVAAEATSLTFASIPAQTYGNAPFTVSASSASPGAITYSVVSGPATISGSTVTITGIGTVTLQASQAASGNYAAATATTSFTVAAAAPTFNFPGIANQTWGAIPFMVRATSNSTGAITYSAVSGPVTVSGNTVTLTGIGTATVRASQAAAGNYTAASASSTFTIAPAAPTLSFAAIGSQTYGNAPFTVSASSASPGAITYSVVSGPATVSGNLVTITGIGTVVLQASQAAAGNYAAAQTTTSFTVAAAAPTFNFPGIANQTWGAVPFMVRATSNSPGAITYSAVSGPVTVSGNTITLTGIGTATVQASQAASGNYTAASASSTFTIAPAAPTLSFAAVPAQTFGNAPFTVSASSASTGAITYSVVSGPATVSGSTITVTGIGTVTIQASQAAAGNYAAASATTAFTVAPAVPTLSFSTIPSLTYGNSPFAVNATSVSPGAITYSVVSGPATISGNLVTLTGAGTVVVQASQAAFGNYTSAIAQTSFTVALPPTPVNLWALSSSVVVGNDAVILVQVPENGNVAPTGTIQLVDGSTPLGAYQFITWAPGYSLIEVSLGVGQHSITASYSGDSNYAPGTSTPVTVTVTQQ